MTMGGWQYRDPEGLCGLNTCVSCEERFAGLSAFDAHIKDDECLPPHAVGLEYRNSKPSGWCWAWPFPRNKGRDELYAHDMSNQR